MIRTRLFFAFVLLGAITLIQSAHAWRTTLKVASLAERSAIAARMLAEYESLGANKQRLKVWFAERMLTGDAPDAKRAELLNAMNHSLAELNRLTQRADSPTKQSTEETVTLASLASNIKIMAFAVSAAPSQNTVAVVPTDQATKWRSALLAFDRLRGQDMREVIKAAIARQKRLVEFESTALNRALAQGRIENTVMAAFAIMLAAFSTWYFIAFLQTPLARLGAAANAFAKGDLTARIGLNGKDEFSQLGTLLNSMAEKLTEAQAKDAQLQKSFDDLVSTRTQAITHAHERMLRAESRRRQFFAEVSHELRTPVTVIRGEAEIALRSGDDATGLKASLKRVLEAAIDLSARVQDLLDVARSGSEDYAFLLQPLEIAPLLGSVVAQLQALALFRGIKLRFEPGNALPDRLCVSADADRLQQALTIVIDNALRYTQHGGQVLVQLDCLGDQISIKVSDNGPGMSDHELAHATEPHFRGAQAKSKNPGGAGLGLSIALRILNAHGGGLAVEPHAPHGLKATLHLPIFTEQS